MQNYYMLEGQAACSAGAPEIAPNVNRLTAAVRGVGATLNNFYRHFGDVQTCDEVIAALEASAKAAAAE